MTECSSRRHMQGYRYEMLTHPCIFAAGFTLPERAPGRWPSSCFRAPLPCLWWWKCDSTSSVSARRAHLQLRAGCQQIALTYGGHMRRNPTP